MKDNSINIVQSYWSDSYNNQLNFGWYNKIFHYMSWALSSLRLSQYYDNLSLVTDSAGAKALIDKLKLPYTLVSCNLDELKNSNKHLWTLGKLYAYEMQENPFIHVDGDVFIWSKFPDAISKAELVAQNEEIAYTFNCDLMEKMLNAGFVFPKKANPTLQVLESNAGIIGGYNTDFFKQYVDETKWFMKNNEKRISNFIDGAQSVNTIMEQYLFHELAKANGISVTYLFKDITTSDFSKFNQFSKLNHSSWYIHAIGSYKMKAITGERIARCLWYEFPEYYDRLMTLINNNEL